MESSQILILVTVFVYLVGMLLIGVYFSRRGGNGSSHDFYLGGRSLGPVVTAMSAEASDMSSYLLMGLPGLAYFCGLPEVTWTCIGLATGTYLNWLIVARRIRRYSDRLGAITVPDFFSRRYGDQRHALSCIAAIVILVFFIPYTASGFKAVGTLFNSLFGFEYHTAMIVGAVVIIAYTVMGGFLAVSTTDLVQSVFMTVALIVVVCFGVGQAGGVDAVLENARSLPGYLNLTQGYDVATGSAASFGPLSIFSTLAWGLGYFGMPHILLRFMAIREEKELNLSRRIATVWVVISMAIAIAIGVIGTGRHQGRQHPLPGQQRRGGDHHHPAREPHEPARLPADHRRRRHHLRHPGRHHVHGGLPAAGRGLQRVPGPDAGLLRHQAQRQDHHAGGPGYRSRHRRYQHLPGLGSQQLRFPGGVLRLGGLRRGLRPRGALRPVLEALQQVGRPGGHGLRRRHGLRLEVPHRPHGRRLEPSTSCCPPSSWPCVAIVVVSLLTPAPEKAIVDEFEAVRGK